MAQRSRSKKEVRAQEVGDKAYWDREDWSSRL